MVTELGFSGGPYFLSSQAVGGAWINFATIAVFVARCTVKLGIFLNLRNEQSLYVRLSDADFEVAAFGRY